MIHTEQAVKDNLSKVEIKDYNAIIDGKNLFDQPIKEVVRNR